MVRRVWDQIAADLREEVTGGRLRPGDPLPTCSEIMARYGVSRATVQRGVDALRAEGLVTTSCGRGWWVRDPTKVLQLTRHDPTGSESPATHTASDGWMSDGMRTAVRVEAATASVSAELKIIEGTKVITWDSDIRATDKPAQMFRLHFPYGVLHRTEVEALARSAIFGTRDSTADAGLRVSLLVERVSAGPSTHEEACRLGITRGCTVLRVLRTVGGRGVTLQVSYMAVPGDQAELVYNVLGR